MKSLFFPSRELAKETAHAINALVDKLTAPVVFLFSGGSALSIVDYLSLQNFPPVSIISVLDERVNKNPQTRNFFQLTKTSFFHQAAEAGFSLIDPLSQSSTDATHDQATGFESFLRKWKKQYSEGKIIITQGMGLDGHTAGIMPFPESPELFQRLFADPGRWVVGYDAQLEKNKYPVRLTVSLSFLVSAVDYSFVFVQGQEKKEIFKKILATSKDINQYPARIIHKMKNVTLYTSVSF